ncbi:MAG: pimeloyl-[acyl-carrier protein] methyl ester esterase [Cellvibrionaceae bacterium]|jgi:pimeloyl-[acyl-carrier protein] methyl ester esterase
MIDYRKTPGEPGNLPIVLFCGWGLDESVWQPLTRKLRSLHSEVFTVDYDLGSNDHGTDIDVIMAALADVLPERSIVCGWSLGGMLATRFAATHPNRVKGLITLASNACFVSRDEWPTAMNADIFQNFYQRMVRDRGRGLQRFCQLISRGDEQADRQLRWLQERTSNRHHSVLLTGLELLAKLDNRPALSQLECPALHLLGAEDILVPREAAQALSEIVSDCVSVQVIDHRGHLLHYPEKKRPEKSTPENSLLEDNVPENDLAAHIERFLAKQLHDQ